MIKRKALYWIKNFILLHVGSFLIILPLFHALVHHPLHVQGEGELIDVPPGISVKVLADNLYQKGLIAHPRVLEWYTRVTTQDTQIRAGEYFVPKGTTIHGLVQLLRSGLVFMHQIRFIEGTTARQMIQIIKDDPSIKHTINFSDPTWFRQFSQKYDNPEGLLMPDTYLFAKWESDATIINRAYNEMHRTLDQAWAHRSPDLPYTDPYSALIAASIIEKETSIPSERAMISGVIMRRLQQHMRLQMDPTVIYALGDRYDGNITKADLAYNSPYNTYTHDGLPPTPICMPSKASILAAVNPAAGTSLYFVATGDGGHHFSDNLQEHQKAVIQYILPPVKAK